MAKKKNNISYLQMPLPTGKKSSKLIRRSWNGLNMRNTVDSGALSMASNISTTEAPYLVPSQSVDRIHKYSNPISMFGFDNFLLVIYRKDGAIKIDYIIEGDIFTGTLKEEATSQDDYPRSVVQFNAYIESDDIVNGSYTKKLLIFPDKMSIDFEISADFKPEYLGDTFPNIKYAAVHLSRLFGVSDGNVYASGFNDYANWNLDTVEEYSENNAWCSSAQSNTKADGDFTGITVYQGHVVCFKRDFMHELYNTKNPFRIQDVYSEGSIDNRSIQDVDGRLIFVSDDNVKVYTGSNPRILSYYLGIDKYKEAVSGTDGRCYYLYCVDGSENKHLFVYDTISEQWSEQTIGDAVLSFAHNKNGMYMLTEAGVYRMDTGVYADLWEFETDLITSGAVDIKHIKKIQLFADFATGAKMNVYLLYDDEKFSPTRSHLVYSSEEHTLSGRRVIRIKPRQTAHYGIKLHFGGTGYVKLHQLELSIEAGGSLYV